MVLRSCPFPILLGWVRTQHQRIRFCGKHNILRSHFSRFLHFPLGQVFDLPEEDLFLGQTKSEPCDQHIQFYIIFSVKKFHCLILIPNPLISFSIKAFAGRRFRSPFWQFQSWHLLLVVLQFKLRAKSIERWTLGFSVLSSAHFLISGMAWAGWSRHTRPEYRG